eukprot:TRINITY_DN112944_c0_g1_i1.p1 TRINITY_DN112944_c0_g1~~TRINITY_DN112944_c0_g1_i1.p1  ORF type:complete len:895 (+),score=193.42 TRINITY_DN112944_c0_g1_i1:90-2774(+)
MPYRPGEHVGEIYEVQRLLGRGAYGEVLKVRDIRDSTTYALKVLPCDGGREDEQQKEKEQREAAFAEAKLLQQLRHPHIVGCYDFFWDEGRQVVHLLLEFMDGGDLQSLLEARKKEAEPVHFEAHFGRRVVAAVGGALRHCHEADVLHRDVKPGNVLLARHSHRIKLADFGIAKLLDMTAHANTLVGTPYYFSPEIVMGRTYGEAADGWSLGIVLFEICMLSRPFEAANQLALVRRIAEDPHPTLGDHVSSDLQKAVNGLLIKDEFKRMTLKEALHVSEAIAALVASVAGFVHPQDQDARMEGPEMPGDTDLSPSASECGSDSWQDVQAAWCGSTAAAVARDALGGDIDDPEELVQALAALQAERAQQKEEDDTSPLSDSAEAALDALESELRVRIDALRQDAAALLDDLMAADSEESSPGGPDDEDGCSPKPPPSTDADTGSAQADTMDSRFGDAGTIDEEGVLSDPSASGDAQPPRWLSPQRLVRHDSTGSAGCVASALEEALEVATTLGGINTEASEDCVARKRGMISLRILWGKVARFCLLPMSVRFDSVVAEVSRRFGLPSGSTLPRLIWREASETFQLTSQADWDECLQRRGLVKEPGRLELRVNSEEPPPVPAHVTARHRALAAVRRGLATLATSPPLLPSPKHRQTQARDGLFSWRFSDSTAPTTTTMSRRPPTGRSYGLGRVASGTTLDIAKADVAKAGSEARYAAAVKLQGQTASRTMRRNPQDLEILEASYVHGDVMTTAAAAASGQRSVNSTQASAYFHRSHALDMKSPNGQYNQRRSWTASGTGTGMQESRTQLERVPTTADRNSPPPPPVSHQATSMYSKGPAKHNRRPAHHPTVGHSAKGVPSREFTSPKGMQTMPSQTPAAAATGGSFLAIDGQAILR